ncbi:MAG: hypothetical protein WKF96_15430 [Solirubrobacteraceae bacterium]
MKHFLVACAALLIAAPGAHATTIIYPQNGATVPSKPVFVPDFATGTVKVEWSRSADLRTDTGEFVAPELDSVFALATYDSPFLAAELQPNSPIAAGRWFWHAKLRNDEGDAFSGTETPWQPARTMVVRDEPIVFAGWTASKTRINPRRCADRSDRYAYALTGTFAWEDNADKPTASYRLKVRVSGKTRTFKGKLGQYETSYTVALCTNGTRATVTPTLIDPAGHRSTAAAKRLKLRG